VVLIADHPQDAEAMLHVLRQARAVAVLLSAGSMTSSQLPLICEVMQLQDKNIRAPGVVSLNMPGFEFPDEEFFMNTLPKVMDGQKATDAETAEALVRLFFKRISMVWPTHASQVALTAQAEVVYKRVSPFLRATASTRNTASYLYGSDGSQPAHHSSGDLYTGAPRHTNGSKAIPIKRSTNSATSLNEITWEAFV